jgi:hypothetical protein
MMTLLKILTFIVYLGRVYNGTTNERLTSEKEKEGEMKNEKGEKSET